MSATSQIEQARQQMGLILSVVESVVGIGLGGTKEAATRQFGAQLTAFTTKQPLGQTGDVQSVVAERIVAEKALGVIADKGQIETGWPGCHHELGNSGPQAGQVGEEVLQGLSRLAAMIFQVLERKSVNLHRCRQYATFGQGLDLAIIGVARIDPPFRVFGVGGPDG